MKRGINKKIAMFNPAVSALKLKNLNPEKLDEEIIKETIDSLGIAKHHEIASIAAVSRALKYKAEGHSDKQIIQRIMNESDEILESVK